MALNLEKVTFGYSREEDRIFIDGQVSGHANIRYWFTERILRQLVTHLLERDSDGQPEKDGATDSDRGHGVSDSLAEEAVIYSAGDPEILVTAIDIHTDNLKTVLIFRGNSDELQAGISLDVEAMRLWIGALKSTYALAAWPQSVWLKRQESPAVGSPPRPVTIH
jgi:hypothetical protein